MSIKSSWSYQIATLCAIAITFAIVIAPNNRTEKHCGETIDAAISVHNITAYIDACRQKGLPANIAEKFGTDLSGTILRNIDFSNVNLANVDLSYADLTSSNFTGANLSNANLTNALVINTYLHDADLSYSNLSGTFLNFSDATGANFAFATMVETDLSYANLTQSNMKGSKLIDPMLAFTDFEGSSVKESATNISRIIHSESYILPVQTQL